MSTEIHCSFCGVSQRQRPDVPMIAGPQAHICGECVQLAAEIVVERRAENGTLREVGGAAEMFATMTKDLEESRSRTRKLESALKMVADAVVWAMPEAARAIRCMWCDLALESNEAARAHVATCEKHPAVIALAEAQAKRGGRAR